MYKRVLVSAQWTADLDEGSMTALIMLDLFAAFKVIDHPILLKHENFLLVSR